VLKIITELGFRFRPLTAADQEAHAAQVGLLAKDLADADPVKLQIAAREWARTERWMPKAADLLALMAKKAVSREMLDAADERGNAHLRSIGRSDCHWFIHNDQVTIGPTA
jgi:hypothetical protein